MSNQGWQETLVVATGDGNAVANTVSATSLLTGSAAQAKYTLPANHFDFVGSQLRIRAMGRISNIVTTPGNLAISVRFGATSVFAPTAFNLNTTAKTNASWALDIMLTCRTIGTAATLFGGGKFTSESLISGAANGTALTALLPPDNPAVGNSFDSTASQQVDLFVQFSVANAGNSIQLHQYSLQVMN